MLVFFLVNKIDSIKDKELLLPHLQMLGGKRQFLQIIPLSAQTGEGIEQLENEIEAVLPVSAPYFPADQITETGEYTFDFENWWSVPIPVISNANVTITDNGPTDRVRVRLPGSESAAFARLRVER